MDRGGCIVHALNSNFKQNLRTVLKNRVIKFSRRIKGIVLRFTSGHIAIPRHSGSFAVLALLSSTIFYGTYAGNHSDDAVKLATSSLGFAVEKVDVKGNYFTSEIDVLGAIGLDGDTSIIGYDVDKVRDELKALPWVKAVTVQKIYPDRLNIMLSEHQPMALWQHNGEVDIVDKDGNVIIPYRAGFSRHLPLIVGTGAENTAQDFLNAMDEFPNIKERVRAYIRIGDRRWDIVLDNGVRVKLPEENFGKRLTQILEMDQKDGLLSRDILSVDLRLDDRVTVALTDEALKRRTETVKELEKREKARKAGRA